MNRGSLSALLPRSIPGGVEFIVADQRFAISIAATNVDTDAARWQCAGLIGYRSLVMCGDARRLGTYGFGAVTHIVAQVVQAFFGNFL